MKKTITLLGAALLGVFSALAQNSCSTSVLIIAGPVYTVDAVNGPEIPVPICANTGVGALHTEWYKYVPTADHSLTVTTDLSQNAGGDTRLNIYQGNCGSLSCVGGGDDQGSVTLASATVQVSGGLTYRIAFDDRWSTAGFDFQLIEGPPVVTTFSFSPVTITANGSVLAAVDMNGDHLDDVVAATTTNININRQLSGGGFTPINITTSAADNTPSWSLCAGDLDNNGYTDLMYGGGGGVTFMMANVNGTAFNEVSFPQYVFCQRTNMVDLNNDGALDAFSCHDVDANVYYTNDGLGNLTFHQGGLGVDCGNYGSIWIDIDNDRDMDLFVARCGCDPVDICYRNNGDGTFTNIAAGLGFADTQQSWSSAWGDFDNDGDMDVLVGSSGSSYHKLMRHDGGNFTNVTVGSGFDSMLGTSIEWTTHDFNNDGYLDILGGGALMLNNGDMTFTPMPGTPPNNGPIGDLDNDGFLDIVGGSTIYMNSGNTNKYIKVNTIGTVSNRNGIGARVEVTSAMGTQIRDVKSGDGFRYMSSLTAHFGLGVDTEVQQVMVYWPSGIVDVVTGPSINSTLNVVEGSHPLGIPIASKSEFSVFPNPAQEVIYVRSEIPLANSIATVSDIAGRVVRSTTLQHDQLDVSSLKSGVYVLHVEANGHLLRQKFTKQ